ncbi:inositol monophosphatase [Photobacterium makurazakiensis]|uniref:inositol monophosphatase family protein n=1 Tax=Photobacterium makurazakiensis TaxID=2910234 RepID=UPI003D0D814D
MNNELQQRYTFVCQLAKEAGQLAYYYQRKLIENGLTIDVKGQQDFVSEADKETEIFIRQQLTQTFPQDGFLGEESGEGSGQHNGEENDNDSTTGTWVVDPIDGTTNFLRKQPMWCVSIAYLVDGVPVIGAIYDPCHDELFSALHGEGAWLNEQPLKVNQGSNDMVGLVNLGYSAKMPLDTYLTTMKRLLDHGIEHRRHGSAALGLAHVAAGRFDGYREDFLNAWDIMAGVVILQEASADVILNEVPGGYTIQACTPALTDLLKG